MFYHQWYIVTFTMHTGIFSLLPTYCPLFILVLNVWSLALYSVRVWGANFDSVW